MNDMVRDRVETRNVISDQPEVARRMRQHLLDQLRVSGAAGADKASTGIPADRAEELRSLGYME